MVGGSRESQLAALLDLHARLTAPPLVPELRVWTAPAVVPFWEAAEAVFGTLESPFWAFPWPGAQGLARYVLDDPDRFAGRRVLDIGAGGGLAALAVARVGGTGVANDVDPLALLAARCNAAANDLALSTLPGDLSGTDDIDADVVFAGDVCYDREAAARLVPWLRHLARTRRVIVADAGRAFAPRSGVTPLAEYTVPTTVDLEGRSARVVTLVELAPE